MKDVPYILSLAYKKQIDEVCRALPQLGLKYFAMYLIFNDGSPFVLSNVNPVIKPYYQEALYEDDYTYTHKVINLAYEGYYLCDEVESISPALKKMLAEKYCIYPLYNIVRRCAECTFVFSAIHDVPKNSSHLYMITSRTLHDPVEVRSCIAVQGFVKYSLKKRTC